jgi:periplasmic divalent cation tolerance protein
VPQNDKPILVYTTCPSAEEAERIGGAIVDRGLAACVNIFPAMTSIYNFNGERHRDTEAAMIIKTSSELAEPVMNVVRILHPYDTPALLILPVDGGSAEFLAWIMTATATPR